MEHSRLITHLGWLFTLSEGSPSDVSHCIHKDRSFPCSILAFRHSAWALTFKEEDQNGKHGEIFLKAKQTKENMQYSQEATEILRLVSGTNAVYQQEKSYPHLGSVGPGRNKSSVSFHSVRTHHVCSAKHHGCVSRSDFNHWQFNDNIG